MPRRDTKQLILDVSLRLFADRGYDGVSMRDIAGEVGIRESALYKHFAGKQEIFDTIVSAMNQSYDQEAATFQLSERIRAILRGGPVQEDLVRLCMLLFQIYLRDERGAQLRRLLNFELLKDTQGGRFFRERVVDDGLRHIESAFAALMQQGYYRRGDPHAMALQFYAPFYLLLTRYDRRPDRYEEASLCIERHIEQFDAAYRKD